VALGTAVLLPSLGVARQSAQRTVEMSDLRQLGIAVETWASENSNVLPEHIAQPVAARMLGAAELRALVSPRSGTKPVVLTASQLAAAEKDWTTIRKIVDDHCDVVYVGAGLATNTKEAGQIIIAYFDPRKVHDPRGINALFLDGHCALISARELADVFKASNKARADAGYEEISLPQLQAAGRSATAPAK
jgi:prepilin-type processing-associated H-X9-DG protein